MLELKNISKVYETKDTKVDAVKNVNIKFRESEFVSILGPSGCGKTTTLNIIGGLDKYTNGDLIIDGKSTKLFKDKDWDAYRNQKIGFVFQNYNLISHLSVLKNVELTLSLNNISSKERRKRAISVLKQVGLKSQINKKPNQLSGGQMQRVAIARALVNNPEIILADEPTGALDTKTSIQILNLLKKISEKKLIIMVTHNEDLANKYSSRIIRFLDGKKVNDSNPLKAKEIKEESKKKFTKKKSSMSFFGAISLSFNNLLTKKGRTFLTAFAGSIGIIGIALVLAINNGFTTYINSMQSDTLSAYPISISTATTDYSKFSSMGGSLEDETSSNNGVTIYDNSLQKYSKLGHYNYISERFLEMAKQLELQEQNKVDKSINLIDYNYYLPLKVISQIDENNYKITKNTNTLSLTTGTGNGIFYEEIKDSSLYENEYDEIYKSSTYSKDNKYSLTLVLEKGNKINSKILKELGFTLEQEPNTTNYKEITFEDLAGKTFKLLHNDDYYTYNEADDSFSVTDENNHEQLSILYNSLQTNLSIDRILVQKLDSKVELLPSGLMYTKQLGEEYQQSCLDSLIATKQQQLKEVQLSENSFTFYAPFTVSIAELSMLPKNGFKNTTEVNYYLNQTFSFTLAPLEAYELAMQEIGVSTIPQCVTFYPNDFEGKKLIIDLVESYNSEVDEAYKLIYTDTSSTILSTLNSLINTISYILVAFAGVSLIVSSIMIGIITYISVIERTKEIGILRSIGARKKDISRVFNAETMLIGLTSGLIGIGLSYLLTIPINLIIGSLADGIGAIAVLNPLHALALIGISVFLTFISGLIPSRIASKKDPVICLRTE